MPASRAWKIQVYGEPGPACNLVHRRVQCMQRQEASVRWIGSSKGSLVHSHIWPSLGCLICYILIIFFMYNPSKLIHNSFNNCFLMYFGPCDVSGIVNSTSDISRNDQTNIGNLIFQQFRTISNKMFQMCINKLTKGKIDQNSNKTW